MPRRSSPRRHAPTAGPCEGRPRASRWLARGLSVLFLPALCSSASIAAPQENEECLSCHEIEGLEMLRDGRQVSLHVDPERFQHSVHGTMDCISCHTDLDGVEEYPHARDIARVECTDCHEDDDGPINDYLRSTHGRLAAEGNPLAPACQDCHGDHYMLRLSDPQSVISPFKVPSMCAQCHDEDSEVERMYDLPQEQVFQRYRQSIHGYGLYEQGLTVTAVCTSCHAGHLVLPHTDPESTINKDNVVATCMQCHGQIEEVHRKTIAGELWEREGVVPICVDCHSPHEARKVDYDTNMRNADCMSCHDSALTASSDGRSLQVDLEEHARSIHGRSAVACARCHVGVTPSEERPCSTISEPVNCSVCHEAEVANYEGGVHGRLHAEGDDNAPYCTDCHGIHGTLEHRAGPETPASMEALLRAGPTYSRNVPRLCGECHRDGGAAAERYMGPEQNIIEHYSMSIHGKGLIESGLTVTAVCTDCHTAHKELPTSDPESTVNGENIAGTCGKCHDGIYEQYEKSVHSPTYNGGYVQLRGMPKLPRCNDCHSSHTMARTDQAVFKLGIMDQCGECHQDIASTYFDTYHGKASTLGDTTKAKCYDCHGAHAILPEYDPDSMLHSDNIVATCAQCHEGSHQQFAGYLPHATHHDRERYPGLYYTFIAMTSLLVGTFAFFGLHTLAWLPRSWKLRKQHKQQLDAIAPVEKQFRRFTAYQRGLHLTVILSFFGLAITGMILKFSYATWAQFLSRAIGGIAVAGWIHRVCAIATFAYMALHLVDVFKRFRRSDKSVRAFFIGPDSLVPRWSDVREFFGTVRWFLGRGPMPRYGRWTYWEKFDYFAVFWGVIVIGLSGLCLWFPEFFTRLLPGWAINVATIIHSDEALLATGFIFTIHFFNTHFRPEKFPMDPVIFTGRMRVKELKAERPELYEQLVQSGELEAHLVEPAQPLFVTLAKAFGFTALIVGFTLIALIVYAMVSAYL